MSSPSTNSIREAVSAAGRVPVLSSFASSCWYSGRYISPIRHLSAFGCRGCTETEPSSLSFLHLHTSAPDAFSVPCSLLVLGLHVSQPWSSQCSAQLQLPPGRSNVCWNPPPTLQSPLNFPPLHSVRAGQCLRASSAGITLVFMSTHSFVLSAAAVDAVITTAALCFPSLHCCWGFGFKYPHGANRGRLTSGKELFQRSVPSKPLSSCIP